MIEGRAAPDVATSGIVLMQGCLQYFCLGAFPVHALSGIGKLKSSRNHIQPGMHVSVRLIMNTKVS